MMNYKLDVAKDIISLNGKLNNEFSDLIQEDIQKYITIINNSFIDNGFNVCVILLTLNHIYKEELAVKLKDIKVIIPTEILIMFDDGSDISVKYTKKKK